MEVSKIEKIGLALFAVIIIAVCSYAAIGAMIMLSSLGK